MCARPLSPRHAQPDWMGGGLVSRQIMHAPPSAAIHLFKRELSIQMGDAVWVEESSNDPMAAELGGLTPIQLRARAPCHISYYLNLQGPGASPP